MQSFYPMKNPIRDYDWGHADLIPRFLNLDWPAGKPAAEVWMGAHPLAPSMLNIQGRWLGMDDWLQSNREEALSSEIAGSCGSLPFLFKLLAAGKSLSIQAHPNKQEAMEGFARENADGVPLDSPLRNYRDDNQKPEIIMALNPFTAMIGFLEPREIAANFWSLIGKGRPDLADILALPVMQSGKTEGIQLFLESLLTMREFDRNYLISQARHSSWHGGNSLQREWIHRLVRQFPSDIGVLSPLFLHVLQLQPGEALYQPPKSLHAYLEGFGVELMANSDNVLRGGLTSKNIDVPELLRILDFNAAKPAVLRLPAPGGEDALEFFPTPAKEFALGVGVLSGHSRTGLRIQGNEGPMVILSLEGQLYLDDGVKSLELAVGESAFVPHCAPAVAIKGSGRAAVAKIGR